MEIDYLSEAQAELIEARSSLRVPRVVEHLVAARRIITDPDFASLVGWKLLPLQADYNVVMAELTGKGRYLIFAEAQLEQASKMTEDERLRA